MARVEDELVKAGIGAAIGTVGGVLSSSNAKLKGPLSMAATGNFSKTAVQSLRHGATLGAAVGAGATAVAGPAAVAAVVAAAPFVAGAVAVGAIGYGLFKLFDD